jgi:hypothetical protein
MRWNEEEEVGRRCVVDGVVIVGVDGVDGVCRRILDQVLRVGSLGVDDDRGSRCRCRRPWPPCQRILGQVLRVGSLGGDGDRCFLRPISYACLSSVRVHCSGCSRASS